jgi:hypothetical protein
MPATGAALCGKHGTYGPTRLNLWMWGFAHAGLHCIVSMLGSPSGRVCGLVEVGGCCRAECGDL